MKRYRTLFGLLLDVVNMCLAKRADKREFACSRAWRVGLLVHVLGVSGLVRIIGGYLLKFCVG